MPLPFALDHINLWVLDDDDGWALVDTGTKTRRGDWPLSGASLLADDGPLAATTQGARVTRVFVTHMHPDHVGMAGWLTRQLRCRTCGWRGSST